MFKVQMETTIKKYTGMKKKNKWSDDEKFGWYPTLLSDVSWVEYISNPFKKEILNNFLVKFLSSPDRDNASIKLTPPYPITYNHITKDIRAP